MFMHDGPIICKFSVSFAPNLVEDTLVRSGQVTHTEIFGTV